MFRSIQHTHYILIFTLILSLPILYLILPKLQKYPSYQHPIPIADEFDDLTLFNRAVSSTVRSTPSSFTFYRLGSKNPKLKIAFLFLTNSNLYLSPLWDRFFNSSTDSYYNIYVHVDPSVGGSDPGGVFSGRVIVGKHTERSSATLISAARRLIANAILDDPLNYYFAILSQSCIPLHSFRYVYETLFPRTPFGFKTKKYKSFIEIIEKGDILPSRYDARGKNVMLPEVPFERFRVGSQFFVLNKKHALIVLKERKLWRKFRLPCIDVHSCYPEEHYFPTLLAMEDLEGCSRYTLTRVNWTGSVDGHPHMYGPSEVNARLIYDLRASNFSQDYLFARKFSPDCLDPLMDLADSVIFND